MREGEENDTFVYEYTSVLYSIIEIKTLFISNIHARLIDNILWLLVNSFHIWCKNIYKPLIQNQFLVGQKSSLTYLKHSQSPSATWNPWFYVSTNGLSQSSSFHNFIIPHLFWDVDFLWVLSWSLTFEFVDCGLRICILNFIKKS